MSLLAKASEGLRALDAGKLKHLELDTLFPAAAAVASAASDAEAVANRTHRLML